ncbi:MAG TPA: hypothetical protein VLE47_00255 [Candidatus Saccharimonadales bacterium]|nr:hypothetical protein [Candidatus Saccharimonadales bacterium]
MNPSKLNLDFFEIFVSGAGAVLGLIFGASTAVAILYLILSHL